jgi:hypothetical protein
MYIHRLGKTTSGQGNRISGGFRGKGTATIMARNHKRCSGSGLKPEIYENGIVHKATENLKGLKIAKPRIPKKYISFDA